jgi:hypothetical protein
MNLNSIHEYADIMRKRYLKANKREKSRILNEFVKVTGYHRKSAIRVLLKVFPSTTGRRGRPATHGSVLQPLKVVWEASDRLCSKRLHPFMTEMIQVLRRKSELQIFCIEILSLGGQVNKSEAYVNTG